MGVPEADDHRRSLPGDTTGGPSQDTELGHGTRQQPLLDQGASHGSLGPALKQRQLGRNSRNLKGNYLCKTPVPATAAASGGAARPTAGCSRRSAVLPGSPASESRPDPCGQTANAAGAPAPTVLGSLHSAGPRSSPVPDTPAASRSASG